MAGALALLPSEQREVLLLHAWAELTNEEIASTLGIAGGTVRSRLSRARSTLRSALVDVGPRRGSADVLGDHAQDARP
jgi:RNA polymerase sigma-70 factor (ECF subfamily)